MLLAVDIGNTNIHNGIFKGRAFKKRFTLPTYGRKLENEYSKRLRPYLGKIDKVIVVSVVPPVLKDLETKLKAFLGQKILVVGRDVYSGVRNLYRRPSQVGQDRLINARAAYELYGGSAIVVDFGTAITLDVINSRKEYLGGVIAPGVELSLNALSERAFLLPKVSIKKPEAILGKETRESMRSGAVYGFSSLCDGVVLKLKRYCPKGLVIATGGMSGLVGRFCKSVDRVDPDLTLKGLELIGRRI